MQDSVEQGTPEDQENEKDQGEINSERVSKISTRIANAPPDTFDPNKPRLGRRESEPHSEEITYLHDVLATNFPESRTTWDLHHYFEKDGIKFDIQFDVALFMNLKIPYTLTSYHANKHGNRVPDAAFNIISKSTWRADVGEHVDSCRLLKIPVYVLMATHHVGTLIYKPPFIRAYLLDAGGNYLVRELHEPTMIEGKDGFNEANVIDLEGRSPFRLGLLRRLDVHQDGFPLHRLLIIDPAKPEVLKGKYEIEQARAEQEKQRAEQEKQRADQEKARADKLEMQLKKYQ